MLARVQSETIKGFLHDADPALVERAILQIEAVFANDKAQDPPVTQPEPPAAKTVIEETLEEMSGGLFDGF